MKRWHITPKAQTLSFDPSRGMDYKVIAEALIREDEEGGWVHYDEALAAIKEAEESVGAVTLRQRYKMAALAGLVSGHMRGTTDEFAHKAAELADAMLKEDEEHAKK